ncbi:MAG: RNA polymerase sigma factor [Cryomorphaceae bacterium]|nr:sigma-70 family RNA polymerase sigma factor [Flavobacteriales bacterium]
MGLFKKSESEKEVLTAKEFEYFFDSYYTSVRNFLYYKCGNAELSEDVAQDAFVKLWETRNRIDKTSLKAYVYTIAANLLINKLKRQTLKYKFLNLQTDRSEKKTPEYLMEMEEYDQKLQATLAKIPDGAREVFLMNRIDDLKYHEISERLGIGIKAVEKRMSKALGIIRAELDKNI